jgi:hypothetical protein
MGQAMGLIEELSVRLPADCIQFGSDMVKDELDPIQLKMQQSVRRLFDPQHAWTQARLSQRTE